MIRFIIKKIIKVQLDLLKILFLILFMNHSAVAGLRGQASPTYKGVQYFAPFLEKSIDRIGDPKKVDQFFLAMGKASQDLTLEESERALFEDLFESKLFQMMKYYQNLRQLADYVQYDEEGRLRPEPLKARHQQEFLKNLNNKVEFFRIRLKKIRQQNPKRFDDILYEKDIQFENKNIRCGCEKAINKHFYDPQNYDSQNHDSQNYNGYINLKTEGQVSTDKFNPQIRSLDLVDTLESLDVFIDCEKRFKVKDYGASATKSDESCKDPYIDRMLSRRDGVFDGYVERYGLPGAARVSPPSSQSKVGSPLGECSLSSLDPYVDEILKSPAPKKDPSALTYVVGKGEAVLEKPCTLLILKYKVYQKPQNGETHQLELLKFRGADNEIPLVKVFRATIPQDKMKLDQILKSWRKNQNNSSSGKNDTTSNEVGSGQ